MDYPSFEMFFKQHLRYKQHWNKKVSIKDAVWQPLSSDTHLDGCDYAAGSTFKVFETSNFGWIVFAPDTLTPKGNRPGKCIIRW